MGGPFFATRIADGLSLLQGIQRSCPGFGERRPGLDHQRDVIALSQIMNSRFVCGGVDVRARSAGDDEDPVCLPRVFGKADQIKNQWSAHVRWPQIVRNQHKPALCAAF
ncbi:MAG: hypothetical protein HWD60_04995 [Defluviicoccus sp.]|nr:MAG: hypothetical protein HWD60_04995 [Defluviicoccus sp.]